MARSRTERGSAAVARVQIGCRASSICVSHRRTCKSACRRICGIALTLSFGHGRRSSPTWMTRHVWSTATLANETCWFEASRDDGLWRLCWTGSLLFPVRRWPISATFSAMNGISRPLVEPNFSDGYLHAGGKLPQDWRQLARLVDLTALCESLTHDELPETVVS